MWAQLNEALNRADRLAADRAATPSLVCVDSQSVKLAPRIFEHRGIDGGKHVNGRKRQIVPDVEGRIFACYVHAANGHDGTAATLGLLPQRPSWGSRLLTVLTDNGYRGSFATHLQALGLRHELASRPPSVRGFVPVAKRWGGRTHLCLAGLLPPLGRRLRVYAGQPPSVVVDCQLDHVP